MKNTRHNRAFTMLEIMVALALLSIIIVAILFELAGDFEGHIGGAGSGIGFTTLADHDADAGGFAALCVHVQREFQLLHVHCGRHGREFFVVQFCGAAAEIVSAQRKIPATWT